MSTIVSDSRPIAQFVEELRSLGAAQFTKTYSDPMLLLRDLGETFDEDEAPAAFHTSVFSREALADALNASGRPGSEPPPSVRTMPIGSVVRVSKRAGGIFSDRIGVGRARNADVPLALPRVSKYHAYFSRGDGGEWTVTDAGSTNGTFVAGTRSPERLPAPVANGDEVSFGQYRFAFYTSEGFLDVVKRRAQLR